MQFHIFCECGFLCALLVATAVGGSDKSTLESVRAMERELGLEIPEPSKVHDSIRRTSSIPGNYNVFRPSVSPNATAIGWWSRPSPYNGEKVPFFWVKSLKEGVQPVWVDGYVANGSHGISFEGQIIVAVARRYPLQGDLWELLAIDRHSGVAVHDLTPFVTPLKVGNYLEDISVSGPGTLVALGSLEEKIQVLEIPGGRTVYSGPGRFPRLSPDGKRLAFVDKDKLLIHSFVDGSTGQLLSGKRVKGVGGWSPDGRFLLAGAWTKVFAFDKSQIIIDTMRDEYAVIGKLGEGNYGTCFSWVSVKLLEQ